MARKFDVIIIGAGHNGLVAAAYLSMAGRKVLVLEANGETGGATQSVRAFPEYDVTLSRYAYLVSLLPDKIVTDLGLRFETRSREMASYTPYTRQGRYFGLSVSREWDNATESSFHELTGSSKEARAWREFYNRIASFAQRLAPTLLEPMPTRYELRNRMGMDESWRMSMERPIAESVLSSLENDVTRGVALTDALIGMDASAYDMLANRCFLYHLVGNGTGEWKVPVGGMGALVAELERVARSHKAVIKTDAKVVGVQKLKKNVKVATADGAEYTGAWLLCNAAPEVLSDLLGEKRPEPGLEGAQVKINLLLSRLPAFRSGIDPRKAFSGTLHINECFSDLEQAWNDSRSGRLPGRLPVEMYCHSLTDPSILSAELQEKGYQTLTLFGLHTPARLFEADNDGMKKLAMERAFAGLNAHLKEPIEDCIARNADGAPCVEVKSPLDLERAIGLPRGNIFHNDLTMPFREESEPSGWGVETGHPNILVCGSGARRGGAVSGIPGHNAAMAVLGR